MEYNKSHKPRKIGDKAISLLTSPLKSDNLSKPRLFGIKTDSTHKSSFKSDNLSKPRDFWHQRSQVNQPRTVASDNRMISSGYGVIVSVLVSYYQPISLPNCLLNWLFTIIVRCSFSSWVAFLPSLPLSLIRVSLAQLSLRGKVTVQAIRPMRRNRYQSNFAPKAGFLPKVG